MYIVFINRSEQNLMYSIDDRELYILTPRGKTSVQCQDSGTMKLYVKHDYESMVEQRRWRGDVYHLVIDSKYTFYNLTNGEEIQISSEKTLVRYNAYYERFFASGMEKTLISEHHSIAGEDKIINIYNKKKRSEVLWERWELVLSPILYTPIIFGFLVLLGTVLSFEYGWKFALFYFPIIYLLFFLSSLFGEFLGRVIFGKDDDTDDILKYLTNEFIKNYYSSSKRNSASK